MFDNLKNSGNLPADVITVTVKLPKQAGVAADEKYKINIHKGRDVSDIIKKVGGFLQKDLNISSDKFRLLFKQCPLADNKSLSQAGVVDDCDMFILLESDSVPAPLKKEVEAPPAQQPISRSLSSPEQIPVDSTGAANEEMLPMPPQEGYTTSPSWVSLCRMSLEELKCLKDFTI